MSYPQKWFVLTIFLLAGCMAGGSKEAFLDALHEYNNGIRWRRAEWMVEHLPEEKRHAIAQRQQWSNELQIAECEVSSVRLKDEDQAVATVRIDWYSLRTPQLKTSIIEQRWQRKDEKWQVTQERLIRGSPFPVFVL